MISPPMVTVRIALVALMLTSAFAGSSAAQTQVDSFTRLPEVLKIGNVIYVEDDAGQRTKGRLLDLSGASLILESGRQRRSFPADRLVRVSQVDSKRNGFLVGFVAGAIPGLFLAHGVNTYCYNESPNHCPGAYFYIGGFSGAIGGWIGSAIDGAIDGETVVFAKQASSTTRVRLTPLLSNRGTGLSFSVRF